MPLKALNFPSGLLGGKARIGLLLAIGLLALALWRVWGQNKSLGREIGAAQAANAAQAESIASLVADKEALSLALQKREKEIEKIHAALAVKMENLDLSAKNDSELAGWGARPLPRGLDRLRRGAGDNANGSDPAHSSGGIAAVLPKTGRGADD